MNRQPARWAGNLRVNAIFVVAERISCKSAKAWSGFGIRLFHALRAFAGRYSERFTRSDFYSVPLPRIRSAAGRIFVPTPSVITGFDDAEFFDTEDFFMDTPAIAPDTRRRSPGNSGNTELPIPVSIAQKISVARRIFRRNSARRRNSATCRDSGERYEATVESG